MTELILMMPHACNDVMMPHACNDEMMSDAGCMQVGVLLGQEELPAEEQHAYIAALLQPLIHQVHCCSSSAPYLSGTSCGPGQPGIILGFSFY